MRKLPVAMLIAFALLATTPAAAYDTDAPRVDVPYKTLCAAIQAARAMLAPLPLPADFRIGKELATGRDALIAVWQPAVSLTEFKVIEVFDGVSRTPGFSVEVQRSNGLVIPGQDAYNGANTFYRITAPDGWYALAIKVNTREPGIGIYQPYNVAYQTPTNAKNGLQYGMDVMNEARRRLDERGVMSRSKPGMKLTEAIDANMLWSLILDEHMDPDETEVRGVEWTVNKALVLFALNRERTYYYAISTAGAGALAQFMPRTYDGTLKFCPAAQLIEDFMPAMRNHVNGVMAMHCHVDQIFVDLQRARVKWPRTPQLLGAVLAASYNAGAGAGIPAYRRHVLFCKQRRYQLRWCHKDHHLPGETISYVRKFAGVYDYVVRLGAFPPPAKPLKVRPRRR